MVYVVNFSRRAEVDLDLLFIAIDAENSAAALKWYVGLREAVLTLETQPNRCPLTPESQNYRHLLYGKRPDVYRVIYEVNQARQEVTSSTSVIAHNVLLVLRTSTDLSPPRPSPTLVELFQHWG